jgi:hypothetical protein
MPLGGLLGPTVLMSVVGVLASCAQAVEIDDPRKPEVLAERNRIIRLLATDLGDDHDRTPAVCQVKVLRRQAPTTWAHASCSVAADAAGVRSAWATFIRVDGEKVSYPQDGSAYELSLRALYPEDLAEWTLEHPTGL